MHPLPSAEPGLPIQLVRNHNEKEGPHRGLNSLPLDWQDTWGQASWGISMGLPRSFPWSKQLPFTFLHSHSDRCLSQQSQGNNTEAACCFILYKGFDEPWKAAVSSLKMQTLRFGEIDSTNTQLRNGRTGAQVWDCLTPIPLFLP